MMKPLFFLIISALVLSVKAQINPQDVTIARDSFGIPHIFAKTDEEVAYGLAWAHSEDDFKNIQYNEWDSCIPYEQMPTVLNPECGFVYNCNNSPLYGAGSDCEWEGDFVGLHKFTYNRGERFKYLLENHHGKFSWADFQRIKFDKSYHNDTNASYLSHFKRLYSLDELKYPDIADAIAKFKRWNLPPVDCVKCPALQMGSCMIGKEVFTV